MMPWYKKLLYIIIAPFIIGAWCLMNPRKVWEQAKKDFGVEEWVPTKELDLYKKSFGVEL